MLRTSRIQSLFFCQVAYWKTYCVDNKHIGIGSELYYHKGPEGLHFRFAICPHLLGPNFHHHLGLQAHVRFLPPFLHPLQPGNFTRGTHPSPLSLDRPCCRRCEPVSILSLVHWLASAEAKIKDLLRNIFITTSTAIFVLVSWYLSNEHLTE